MITNKQKDKKAAVRNYIKNYLREHGGFCFDEEDTECIPPQTDCILVLGGDGTLLQAARDTIDLDIPLLGVNLGTLGYLAEIEEPNLEMALKALLADEYELEDRMMLEGTLLRGGIAADTTHALNDIVLARSGPLMILQFHIWVNGQFLKSYEADGMILSTPTGSTGYNMSAGGPIVEPKAKLMLLTPICPHTFNARSIILAPEDLVTVELAACRDSRRQQVEASYDGGHVLPLEPGDILKITQSSRITKIAKLNQVSFLEVLHRKMSDA